MYQELLDTATRAAQAGGEVLLDYFRNSDLEVHAKGSHDFVTTADHESEARIVAEIRRIYPSHAILAEESGFSDGDADDQRYDWLVDPLDGTTNFLHGLPTFGISVACRRGPEVVAGVVLDPVGGNLFSATRGGGAYWNGRPMKVSSHLTVDGAFLATGYPFRCREALDLYLQVFRTVFLRARAIRRCGAAALDLAYTAAGVYDGFFELRLSPWDFAAGVLLLEEAGGRITDLDGGRAYFRSGNLVAGSIDLHGELLTAIQTHADEAILDRVDPVRNKATHVPVT